MEQQEYHKMYRVEEILWWYRGLRDMLAYYLHRAPRGAKILDAGCGTGMNMRYAQSLGYMIYGIDSSSKAVFYAKKRGLLRVKKGTVTTLPFPKSTFDVVLSMDVIGLLPDEYVAQMLAESYRVLKKGGMLILHTAAFEFLRSGHDVVSHVKRRYTKRDLINLFDVHQWKIEKVSYRMCFLFLPLAMVKLMKRLLQHGNETGDLYMPSQLLNALLYEIQKVENVLLKHLSFPFGTSLLVIVKKK